MSQYKQGLHEMTDFFIFGCTFVHTVAKFIVPDWGIKLTPASKAGRYDNSMPESTLSPVRDYEFGY